jgi:hypothetical protein
MRWIPRLWVAGANSVALLILCQNARQTLALNRALQLPQRDTSVVLVLAGECLVLLAGIVLELRGSPYSSLVNVGFFLVGGVLTLFGDEWNSTPELGLWSSISMFAVAAVHYWCCARSKQYGDPARWPQRSRDV